jgi:hypothetical protein
VSARIRDLDAAAVRSRASDARKLQELAELVIAEHDSASWKAAGSNAVLAGIAAADAICGYVLGHSSKNADHREAVELLKRATSPDPGPPNDLRRLIGEKSLFQYGSERVTQGSATDLVKYSARLVAEMERRLRN